MSLKSDPNESTQRRGAPAGGGGGGLLRVCSCWSWTGDFKRLLNSEINFTYSKVCAGSFLSQGIDAPRDLRRSLVLQRERLDVGRHAGLVTKDQSQKSYHSVR